MPALVGNSSETSIKSLCLFGACRGAKGYEQSWIPELSMIPISLCQSDPLPGRKLGFLFPIPQKEDHTLVALWSSTFHPLMMQPNPVPYQRQELLEMMMRNDVPLIAKDGKTTLFNISTFLLKYNTYRGKYTNYKCTARSRWQGKIHISTGLQHF